MKWHTLSESGAALIQQLARDSKSWLDRGGKMTRTLRELGALGEPAAIGFIAGFLIDDDSLIREEAARAAETLFEGMPLDLLPALDERVRCDGYSPDNVWGITTPRRIERLDSRADSGVPLGLVSFHSSGYVRQSAIIRMDREMVSGAEIPFLLLRLNDWVDSVRHCAEQAIARRLGDSHFEAYAESLSLIARLRCRQRAGESPFLARIEALLQTKPSALVVRALASKSPVALRFGISLALDATSDALAGTKATVLDQLIQSSRPAARLQAAWWLAKADTATDLQNAYLPRLLNDRVVAVRRVAFDWCATHDPARYVDVMHAALLDPSTAIRSIAQFHLPKLESIDVRSFYRDTVIGGEPRVLKAALRGLGETGQTTDAGLIVPLTNAPEPSVCKAALVSLAKLAMDAHIEIFVTALQSRSPGVSRQARIALEGCAASIGANRLETIFTQTPHPHVRKQAVSLISHLPKWQKLPLLIDIFGGPDAETQKLAHYHICRWFQNFNRTHQVQPTKADVVRLQVALAAHGSKFERTLERELRATVASLATRQ